jgi:transposase
MASTEIRDRRRTLRYRNLVLKQMVQRKNRVSGLLMESGVSYNKQRVHKLGYSRICFPTTTKSTKVSAHYSGLAANTSSERSDWTMR